MSYGSRERHTCVTCCCGCVWATGGGGGPVAAPPTDSDGGGGHNAGGLPGRPSDNGAIIGGVVGGELRQGETPGRTGMKSMHCACTRVLPYTCTEVLLLLLRPAGVGGALTLAGLLALVLWRRKQQRWARDCMADVKVDQSDGR